MKDVSLKAHYTESHALVIGINNYMHASPLEYAVNDAQEVAFVLEQEHEFAPENIKLLLNEDAQRDKIISTFLNYADRSHPDDRLLVFFAGHGHTRTGYRGDVGFLVPQDGDTEQLSTLIGWNELTKSAEMILAKHILFIMDACYGGLALPRLSAGAARFLKDMMLRRSRQVLTAGKADEVVSDAGGPLPNHSVFTGHLIEALKGAAQTEHGIITANGVMAYVYNRVSKDPQSDQTPHYGFIDGDGDFVFKAPELERLSQQVETDEDILVSVPAINIGEDIIQNTLENRVKSYLSDKTLTIQLHDLSVQYTRRFLDETTSDHFPISEITPSDEELINRLTRYEACTTDIRTIMILVAHWGDLDSQRLIRNTVGRMTDFIGPEVGVPYSSFWIELRWYPVILMSYATGIAAISAENYSNLNVLFNAHVNSSYPSRLPQPLVLALGEAIRQLEISDTFKRVPGHERNFTPRSEYLYKFLQPQLDDLLFFGKDYERYFDEFEIMFALLHVDLNLQESPDARTWGPVGRFGWKHRDRSQSPFLEILKVAKREKTSWPPLNAGLFGGSYKRFKIAAEKFQTSTLDKLRWY